MNYCNTLPKHQELRDPLLQVNLDILPCKISFLSKPHYKTTLTLLCHTVATGYISINLDRVSTHLHTFQVCIHEAG